MTVQYGRPRSLIGTSVSSNLSFRAKREISPIRSTAPKNEKLGITADSLSQFRHLTSKLLRALDLPRLNSRTLRVAKSQQHRGRRHEADSRRCAHCPVNTDNRSGTPQEQPANRPEPPVHKEKTQHTTKQMRRRRRLQGGIETSAKGDKTKTHRNQ